MPKNYKINIAVLVIGSGLGVLAIFLVQNYAIQLIGIAFLSVSFSVYLLLTILDPGVQRENSE